MDGVSKVLTMLNQGVGNMTKWNGTSVRCMCYKRHTLYSLGLAKGHYLIQLPGHHGQVVLERGGLFLLLRK